MDGYSWMTLKDFKMLESARLTKELLKELFQKEPNWKPPKQYSLREILKINRNIEQNALKCRFFLNHKQNTSR